MGILDLAERVAVTDGLFALTSQAAWGLFAALSVTALCFSGIRTTLLGSGSDTISFGLRFLFVFGVLSAYSEIFDALLSASAGMAEYFASQAGWDTYWQAVIDGFKPLFAGESSRWDRFVGWLKASMLTSVVSVTYYFEFLVFDWIQGLTSVFVGLLRVLGPFMVAAGVLGQGATLRQWFTSLVQVLLWPVVPPFLMFMTVGISGHALATGNIAFVAAQNLVLAFMALLTPVFVAFLMGRGGIGALATTVATVVTGLAYTAGATALPYLAKKGAMGGGLLARVAGQAAQGLGSLAEGAGHSLGDRLISSRPGEAYGLQMGLQMFAAHQATGASDRAGAAAFVKAPMNQPNPAAAQPPQRPDISNLDWDRLRAADPMSRSSKHAVDRAVVAQRRVGARGLAEANPAGQPGQPGQPAGARQRPAPGGVRGPTNRPANRVDIPAARPEKAPAISAGGLVGRLPPPLSGRLLANVPANEAKEKTG